MFNTAKVASILISFTAVHIYDFHVFSHLYQCISVSKLWVYIGINVRSFVMVAFQLILIIQVVSALQVELVYKLYIWNKWNMTISLAYDEIVWQTISSAIWNNFARVDFFQRLKKLHKPVGRV